MRSEIKKQENKHFVIKSYQYQWQLEDAIKKIRANASEQLQLSVIGQLAQKCIVKNKEIIESGKAMKRNLKGALGTNSHFGVFCNLEIGTLFIAGTLAPQFLSEIDGKVLGEMSYGPYSILRGLGIEGSKASSFLKSLNNGHFLVLIRGYDNELDKVATLFES